MCAISATYPAIGQMLAPTARVLRLKSLGRLVQRQTLAVLSERVSSATRKVTTAQTAQLRAVAKDRGLSAQRLAVALLWGPVSNVTRRAISVQTVRVWAVVVLRRNRNRLSRAINVAKRVTSQMLVHRAAPLALDGLPVRADPENEGKAIAHREAAGVNAVEARKGRLEFLTRLMYIHSSDVNQYDGDVMVFFWGESKTATWCTANLGIGRTACTMMAMCIAFMVMSRFEQALVFGSWCR